MYLKLIGTKSLKLSRWRHIYLRQFCAINVWTIWSIIGIGRYRLVHASKLVLLVLVLLVPILIVLFLLVPILLVPNLLVPLLVVSILLVFVLLVWYRTYHWLCWRYIQKNAATFRRYNTVLFTGAVVPLTLQFVNVGGDSGRLCNSFSLRSAIWRHRWQENTNRQ